MNWLCRSAALFVLASDWSCCVLSVLHCVSFEAMSSNLGSLFPTQCLSYLPPHLRPGCFCGFITCFFSVAAFKWFTILLFLQRVLVKIAWEPHRFERAVFYLHVIPEWHCVICMTKLVRVRGSSSELYRVWGETDPFHRCCGLKYASFRFCWPCRVLATSGVVAVYWKWAVLIMSQNHFIGWEYIYIYSVYIIY